MNKSEDAKNVGPPQKNSLDPLLVKAPPKFYIIHNVIFRSFGGSSNEIQELLRNTDDNHF